MAENRYYWLRLHTDFFDSKRIKKLRRIAGGATYVLIYLKLLLLAIKTDGIIEFTHLEDAFADELALDIDESPDDVAFAVSYLLKTGLAESNADDELFLPWAVANTGSEGSSAKRMRESRAREKAKLLPSSQCDELPSLCAHNVTERKSKSKNKSKSKEIEYKADEPQRVFKKPSLQEVKEYCTEKGYHFDPEEFIDHYDANGWKVGRTAMKDWKATCRTWERRNAEYGRKPISGTDTPKGTAGRFDGLQLYDA